MYSAVCLCTLAWLSGWARLRSQVWPPPFHPGNLKYNYIFLSVFLILVQIHAADIYVHEQWRNVNKADRSLIQNSSRSQLGVLRKNDTWYRIKITPYWTHLRLYWFTWKIIVCCWRKSWQNMKVVPENWQQFDSFLRTWSLCCSGKSHRDGKTSFESEFDKLPMNALIPQIYYCACAPANLCHYACAETSYHNPKLKVFVSIILTDRDLTW